MAQITRLRTVTISRSTRPSTLVLAAKVVGAVSIMLLLCMGSAWLAAQQIAQPLLLIP